MVNRMQILEIYMLSIICSDCDAIMIKVYKLSQVQQEGRRCQSSGRVCTHPHSAERRSNQASKWQHLSEFTVGVLCRPTVISTVVVSVVSQMANKMVQLITQDTSEKHICNTFFNVEHKGATMSPQWIYNQFEAEMTLENGTWTN